MQKEIDPMAKPATPKGPRCKQSSKINPYSMRGLDKFSTVMADLGARREKILAGAGGKGVSLVRFMRTNSDDWVPVVVRQSDERREQESKKVSANVVESQPIQQKAERSQPERGESWFWSLLKWRPSDYWPLVLVLILLCLVLFGRVFAICCTLVCWYLLPSMKGQSGHVRRSVKKKRKAI